MMSKNSCIKKMEKYLFNRNGDKREDNKVKRV